MGHFTKAAAIAAISALALGACGGQKEPEPKEVDLNDPASVMEAIGSMQKGDAKATGPMKVYADGMDKIAAAVAKVDNEASAKTAARQIADVAKDMKKLEAQFEGMSDQEKTAMAMSNAGAITQSGMRVATEMMRLQSNHPELMKIISDEMDKIPELN